MSNAQIFSMVLSNRSKNVILLLPSFLITLNVVSKNVLLPLMMLVFIEDLLSHNVRQYIIIEEYEGKSHITTCIVSRTPKFEQIYSHF